MRRELQTLSQKVKIKKKVTEEVVCSGGGTCLAGCAPSDIFAQSFKMLIH